MLTLHILIPHKCVLITAGRTGSYVGVSPVSSAKTALVTKKKKAETEILKR